MAAATRRADRKPDPSSRPRKRGLFPPHQPYPPERRSVDEASEESFPASDAPSTWSREE